MAPQVQAVAPNLCDADGGMRVQLQGTFVMGRSYRVYVGGDATGLLCYSGVSGQGSGCVSPDGVTLGCALPQLPPGDVPLYVSDTVDGTGAAVAGLLRAEAPFLSSMTYSLRRNMRSTLNVGDLDPATLPDAAVVPGFVPV